MLLLFNLVLIIRPYPHSPVLCAPRRIPHPYSAICISHPCSFICIPLSVFLYLYSPICIPLSVFPILIPYICIPHLPVLILSHPHPSAYFFLFFHYHSSSHPMFTQKYHFNLTKKRKNLERM